MQIEFGAVLKDIRIKNKWTLEEMAQKLGTTKQAISKYERGERTPKITVAARFADILGVPLESLVGAEDETAPLRVEPKNEDIRVLVKQLNKLSPAQLQQAKDVFRAMFAITNPELFEGEEDQRKTIR